MPNLKSILAILLLACLALYTVACGSSVASNRVLQSIAVTPASANAQDFPDGKVQFTATGTFSKPPSPENLTFQAPYSGGWLVQGTNASNIATIDANGVAVCIGGTSGTVTVVAEASANSGMGSNNASVATSGTATLTCP